MKTCGYSIDVPQWGASIEYLQHMFSWNADNLLSGVMNKYMYLKKGENKNEYIFYWLT